MRKPWTDRWTALLERWGQFMSRHRVATHVVLGLLVVAAAVDLRSARVNPDWLGLFEPQDPVLLQYQRYAADGEGGRTLYLKLQRDDAGKTQDALIDLSGVVMIRPLPPAHRGSPSLWFALVLDPKENPADYERTAEEIRQRLRKAGLPFGLTGAPVLLQEFRDSVQRDFVWTSLLSLALVGGVLLLILRSPVAVLLGIGYELAGLLVAVALCVRLTGDLNMLSAALPCVLVGLGADFVIHCLAVAGDPQEPGLPSVRIYRRLAVPMFGGALTTAAAFASLALADLQGLRTLGALGALGMLCMFVTVLLVLPPMLDRIRRSAPHCPTPVWLPRKRAWRRGLGLGLALACLVLAAFAGRLRSEDRLDHLYDPNLPSLVLQSELAGYLGVYPSPLFLAVDAFRLTDVADQLAAPGHPFQLVLPPGGLPATGKVIVPLFARENPFAADAFASLKKELAKLLGGPDTFVLTGEAAVSLHLNHLLQRGMTLAFGAVFLVLLAVLILLFRRTRFVAGPLTVLLLVMGGILGLMGLLGIRLSAYTLTLFPLFVGIGVDDCLYVTQLARDGKVLRESPETVLAITLTTVTTVFGYGSLLTAHNAGFQAMGATASIGLILMYAGAVYLLPALLGARSRRPAG
jgi:predicted RND superfamily exporter protein